MMITPIDLRGKSSPLEGIFANLFNLFQFVIPANFIESDFLKRIYGRKRPFWGILYQLQIFWF